MTARRWVVAASSALLGAATAVAQVGPSTAPTTRSGPVDITPATGPTAVPFTLSGTEHLVVRAKINGHGPYNFVVDTGAPTLLVDEGIAAQIGLRPDPSTRPATRATTRPATSGWATIDRLDLEGGLSMSKVKCLVRTPYQITGMNAMGVAGMELHGMMGYSVLARFKIELDLTRNEMQWTPQQDFVPAPLQTGGDKGGPDDADDVAEERLEMVGGAMRFLGPLVKASLPGPARPRGLIGLEFAAGTVAIDRVLGGSPAVRAGLMPGDQLLSIDGHAVRTAADAEAATAHALPDDKIRLVVRRGPATRAVTVTAGEGL